MNLKPKYCPNKNCDNHSSPKENFYRKKGYYKTKKNSHRVPKYQCKECEQFFSSNTFKTTYRQRKTSVNKGIFNALCSGVTQRRTAKIMGVARQTVVNKFLWLSKLAKEAHLSFLEKDEVTSYVQFDEMETFEHTKLKPVSIALAVRAKTGEIIGVQVAEMKAKGHIASKSVEKYGLRDDEREDACSSVIEAVKSISKENISIACDGKKSYPNIIKRLIPNCNVIQYVSRNSKKMSDSSNVDIDIQEQVEAVNRKVIDPLFMLNHTCAKLRADISRLIRRTWSTTKNKKFLQRHLDLYIAYTNGYPIFDT